MVGLGMAPTLGCRLEEGRSGAWMGIKRSRESDDGFKGRGLLIGFAMVESVQQRKKGRM